jgi:hypothetical protein
MNLNVSDNIWSSDKEKLLFQVTNKVKKCGLTMLETTEGIFLAENLNLALNKVDRELKTLHHMILADSDYKELLNIKRASKINQKVSKNLCKTIKMILNIYKKQHNKYLLLNDNNGNEVTLFNNDGVILVANCINVSKINIHSKMKDCVIQPKIQANIFNKLHQLSLFDDNIIAFNKDVIKDCKKRKLTLINNKQMILTLNGTNELIELDNKEIDLTSPMLEKEEFSFEHSSLFKEKFDPIKQIERISKLNDLNGHYYIMPEIKHLNTNETEDISVGLVWLNKKFTNISNIISITMSLTVLLVVITICVKKSNCSKDFKLQKLFKYKKRNSPIITFRNNNEQTVEFNMDNNESNIQIERIQNEIIRESTAGVSNYNENRQLIDSNNIVNTIMKETEALQKKNENA